MMFGHTNTTFKGGKNLKINAVKLTYKQYALLKDVCRQLKE